MLVLYLVRFYYYARVILWLGFTIMLVLYCVQVLLLRSCYIVVRFYYYARVILWLGFTIMLVLYCGYVLLLCSCYIVVRFYYYARVISWLGFTIMLVLYCGQVLLLCSCYIVVRFFLDHVCSIRLRLLMCVSFVFICVQYVCKYSYNTCVHMCAIRL